MIITISNQKGGVGKTTTSQSFAAGLKLKGYGVLLIDLDPQSNLSRSVKADNESATIYEVLKNEVDINDAIQQTETADIIPSNILLSGAEMEFISIGREKLLIKSLKKLKKQYDFIVIDTPPALGILTINALSATDKLIIPMEADSFSLQGLGQLNQTLELIREDINDKLTVGGILLTKYDKRTKLTQDLTDIIKEATNSLQTKLFNTKIRSSIAIREAQLNQAHILNYSNSNAQQDYLAFVEEFLNEVKPNE